jgi:hypothetical protein
MTFKNAPSCDISNTNLSFASQFILNSFLHITVLFIFLNGLFIYIIVPLTTRLAREEIGHQLINMIDKLFPKVIDFNLNDTFNCTNITDPVQKATCIARQQVLDTYIKSLPLFNTLNIRDTNDLYKAIKSFATTNKNGNNILDNYILEYSVPNKLIVQHNKDIVNYGINISIILLIMTIIIGLFLKYSCNKCINITKVLLENIITFSFVGAIEYWFFMTFAIKFIPAPPSTLVATAIDTVKSYLVPIPDYPPGYSIPYSAPA